MPSLMLKFDRQACDHSLEAQTLDHAEIKSGGVTRCHGESCFAIGLRTLDEFDDPCLVGIENPGKPRI